MSRFSSSLYRPYGAYELKATYQRNLLLGMLATTTLIILMLAAGWVLGGAQAPIVIPEDTIDKPVITSINLDEPPIVIPNEGGPGRIAPPVIEGVVAGLQPVDDDTFIEEPVVLATREERAILAWGGVEGVPPGEQEGQGYGYGSGAGTGDYLLPERGAFTPHEVSPELIHRVEPEYPRFARQAGLEGEVYIQALVSREGSVLDVVVFRSSGHRLLDEAALAVAWKYKYSPAIQNGSPIALWVTYKVEFTLD